MNYKKVECKHCFHGWVHDVEREDGSSCDEECFYCDGSGYLYIEDSTSNAFKKEDDVREKKE